jgi:hypothetical protein
MFNHLMGEFDMRKRCPLIPTQRGPAVVCLAKTEVQQHHNVVERMRLPPRSKEDDTVMHPINDNECDVICPTVYFSDKLSHGLGKYKTNRNFEMAPLETPHRNWFRVPRLSRDLTIAMGTLGVQTSIAGNIARLETGAQ